MRLLSLVTGRDGERHCPGTLCGEVAHDDINQVRHGTGWEDCYSFRSVVAVEFLQNLVDGGCGDPRCIVSHKRFQETSLPFSYFCTTATNCSGATKQAPRLELPGTTPVNIEYGKRAAKKQCNKIRMEYER